MTPIELKEYLQVFKDAGVASAQLTVAGGTVAVVFSPEPFDMGPSAAAGGWKSLPSLDNPQQFEAEVP